MLTDTTRTAIAASYQGRTTQVSYEDQANPLRTGTVVEHRSGEYRIAWDDDQGGETWTDLRQPGWTLADAGAPEPDLLPGWSIYRGKDVPVGRLGLYCDLSGQPELVGMVGGLVDARRRYPAAFDAWSRPATGLEAAAARVRGDERLVAAIAEADPDRNPADACEIAQERLGELENLLAGVEAELAGMTDAQLEEPQGRAALIRAGVAARAVGQCKREIERLDKLARRLGRDHAADPETPARELLEGQWFERFQGDLAGGARDEHIAWCWSIATQGLTQAGGGSIAPYGIPSNYDVATTVCDALAILVFGRSAD